MRAYLWFPLAVLLLIVPARAQQRKPTATEKDYFKVDVRGKLSVSKNTDTDGRSLVEYKASTGAVVDAEPVGRWELYLGGKEVLQLARKLNGKRVIVTGRMAVVRSPKKVGLGPSPAPRYVVVVTGLTSADPD
jgi:hypothetical protein